LRQSVDKLEQFYTSKKGIATKTMVLRRLHTLWPHLEGHDVLGFGYSLPFLSEYEKRAHSIVYAQPGGQGITCHKTRRGNASVVVPDPYLPFPPGHFDRVLIAHGFEESADFQTLLSELWRVMKPEGRIVVVAAARAGLWSRNDKTPFGAGRPFSRRQLSNALKREQFVPLVRSGALYSPPLDIACGPKMSRVFEKFGETVWPGFSGLVLVEAVKRLYAGHDGKARKRVLRPAFAGSGALGAPGKVMKQNKDVKKHGE
jgi:SAM-dependent methyltransferase